MVLRNTILGFLIILSSFSFSQRKNELSIDFSVNTVQYNMHSLNEYFKDSNIFYAPLYKDAKIERRIEAGKMLSCGLNYQPFDYVSFGVFSSYNYSRIEIPLYWVYEPEPGFPEYNVISEGDNSLSVSAISFGLSTQIYVNRILHFEKKQMKWMQKLEIAPRFSGGVAYSTHDQRGTLNGSELHNVNYKSNDFYGKAELNLGYRIEHSLICTFGLNMGYQYLRTGDLVTFYDKKLEYGSTPYKTVSLDFSAFYVGAYIKLAK